MFLNAAVPEILASISLFLIVRTYISHVSKSYFKEKCMGEIGAGIAIFSVIKLAVNLSLHNFTNQVVQGSNLFAPTNCFKGLSDIKPVKVITCIFRLIAFFAALTIFFEFPLELINIRASPLSP